MAVSSSRTGQAKASLGAQGLLTLDAPLEDELISVEVPYSINSSTRPCVHPLGFHPLESSPLGPLNLRLDPFKTEAYQRSAIPFSTPSQLSVSRDEPYSSQLGQIPRSISALTHVYCERPIYS